VIFPPDIARKIARGEKTMIRRVVDERSTDEFGFCRIKVGRRYAVEHTARRRVSEVDREARERVHVAWMVVTEVRKERLRDITPDGRRGGGLHPPRVRRRRRVPR
jgi:lipoate synthase